MIEEHREYIRSELSAWATEMKARISNQHVVESSSGLLFLKQDSEFVRKSIEWSHPCSAGWFVTQYAASDEGNPDEYIDLSPKPVHLNSSSRFQRRFSGEASSASSSISPHSFNAVTFEMSAAESAYCEASATSVPVNSGSWELNPALDLKLETESRAASAPRHAPRAVIVKGRRSARRRAGVWPVGFGGATLLHYRGAGRAVKTEDAMPGPAVSAASCWTLTAAATAAATIADTAPAAAAAAAAAAKAGGEPTAAVVRPRNPKATRTVMKEQGRVARRAAGTAAASDHAGKGRERCRAHCWTSQGRPPEARSCRPCAIRAIATAAAAVAARGGGGAMDVVRCMARHSQAGTYWCPDCLAALVDGGDLLAELDAEIRLIESGRSGGTAEGVSGYRLVRRLARLFSPANKCAVAAHAARRNNGLCRCAGGGARLWRGCAAPACRADHPYAGLAFCDACRRRTADCICAAYAAAHL